MARKAIFIDRDDTLIEDYRTTRKITLLEGVKEFLEKTKKLGFMNIVISNQSDYARGNIPKKELDYINDNLMGILPLDGLFYCPHLPEENCHCRKPKPKMILDAAKKYIISLPDSYMIGDKDTDIQCGIAAGCKVIKITKQNGIKGAELY